MEFKLMQIRLAYTWPCILIHAAFGLNN